jgi:hypothetical protein
MEEPTEDPNRLFRLTSEITLRREEEGRTRRYEDVPVDWIMERGPDEAPFDPEGAVEGTVLNGAERSHVAVAQLFARDEALRYLEALEESYPEGEHSLQSVPLPALEENLRHGPGRARGRIEAEGEDLLGYPYPQDAERTGWERGDTLLVETTLELPVELAERLESKDAARYIGRLEETAEAVSDAPNPAPVDTELPF